MGLKSYCMGCGHPLPWGATCKVCPKVDPDANVADLAQAVVDRDAAIARLTRERETWERSAALSSAECARLTRERDEARAERDAMNEELALLRACVSEHLHGNGQTLANAYAALRRFDQRRRADAIEAGEHDK